mgnify:FL=1|tara:strand:- start:320 stop:499 length:180 start_codon:yes stop_codon:yes gene_type:complete
MNMNLDETEKEFQKQRAIEGEINLLLNSKKDKHDNIKFIINENNCSNVGSEISFYKKKN